MDCCTLINTNQDLQEDNKDREKEMDMSVHKGMAFVLFGT